MMGDCVITISGEMVDMDKIRDIAGQVVALIMSELPEEVQTYDTALYILKKAKEQVKGSKVKLFI